MDEARSLLPWNKRLSASSVSGLTMYEKLYRTEGRKPAEELHKLLVETRIRHERFKVTLGAPPFERDGVNRITGIRLRFTPQGSAQVSGPARLPSDQGRDHH